MALDTERSPASNSRADALRAGLTRLTAGRFPAKLGANGVFAERFFAWLQRLPIVRFISANLWRRILAANLIGLVIMIVGFHILWPEQVWVIDAKRDALKIQGEIIASAIATNATVEGDNMVVDTYKLQDRDQSSQAPFRDDGFAAFELSIRPERVTPILRRLIQPTKTRARIYGKDLTLIVDSANLLGKGQIARPEPSLSQGERPKTKNFWTRLIAWLIDKELPVYTEIGTANGGAYPEVREALSGVTTAMMLLTSKGEQIVSVAVPIQRRNTIQGVLLLSTPPGEIDSRIWDGRAVLWTLGLIALLATLVTSFLLARTVADPMRRLSEAAEHVSHNISARQELPDYADRTDEVGQMATAFTSMTAALYRRIEASENFAADVAHELKNPLTAARSIAESLTYAKTVEQRDFLVQQIQNELKRLNRLINDVSNASRLDAELARQKMIPVNVVGVLEAITKIFREILSEDTRRVSLVVEPAPFAGAYVINGDDGRLGQVVTNLVDNAVSFSPENGVVTLRARHKGPFVEILVDDQGPGMPEDRLKIIFDRFYTDRPATEAANGKNSGLGLSISREIVRAHAGEIWAENIVETGARPDSTPTGARFAVRLPAVTLATRGGTTLGRRV